MRLIPADSSSFFKILLLPRALLVAMGFQALAALVLVHLETTLLFQIAHGKRKVNALT
jgi:hypothetical protein